MHVEDLISSQGRRALIALATLALAAAVLAAPANAAKATGKAALLLAEHEQGRTLSGQGVKILANAPATSAERALDLPIGAVKFVEPGAVTSATSEGWLSFKKGKKTVTLSEISFNVSAGTLSGKLGGTAIDVFRVIGPASASNVTGSVGIEGAKLTLMADAATALKQKLGLERALRHDGVGMAWLSAKANPAHATPKAISSGGADWGVLASWRSYVLGQQGPPMSKGTITVEGGATANGNLSEAGAFFGFPATSGTYTKGLYGAADKLVLKTQGTVKFAKPFHCIIEIEMAELEVVIDGANSSIVVGDYGYDIDKFNGMACEDQPAVLAPGTKFATLNLSGVSPTYSANSVTWTAIPATLTAAGAVPFAPTYKAGQALDPVTVAIAWSGPIAIP
jgi:hypothetical protein